jgi:gamma-glutamylcysteine synthetase
MMFDQNRKLARHETHDLSMIIKDRTKVLKAHVEQQAAACLADFEKKMAAIYKFDDDEIWKAATAQAQKIVDASQQTIAARCKKLGIPKEFAPSIELSWRGRGENMMASRRAELRRVAQASIEVMSKAAVTKIEQQSLDLRTQVVALGLLSADAKMFLESLKPIEDTMRGLDFVEMERKLICEKEQRRLNRPSWEYES